MLFDNNRSCDPTQVDIQVKPPRNPDYDDLLVRSVLVPKHHVNDKLYPAPRSIMRISSRR